MSLIDTETKRKLREMGVTPLLDAFEAQDDVLALGLAFQERVKLAVDDAHGVFTQSKVDGLIRRAPLRYPNADLRLIDMIDQRGLDRAVIAGLGACSFIDPMRAPFEVVKGLPNGLGEHVEIPSGSRPA